MADRLGDAEIGIKIRDLGISQALAGIRSNIQNGLTSVLTVASGNLLSGAVTQIADQVKNLVSAGISANAQFEQMTVSMATMLGSQRQSVKLMNDLRDLAARSPFGMLNVSQAATSLLATKQIAQDEVIPVLEKLGDAAAGSAIGFQSLPRIMLAVSQMLSAGKIAGQDMNQLAQAGIPAWSLLAKQLGITQAEARKLSAEGKLGAEAVRALIDGLGAGYEGLMQKQANSFRGLISQLRDLAEINMAKITKPIYDEITGVMQGLVKGAEGGGGLAGWVDVIAEKVQQVVQFIKEGFSSPLVAAAAKFAAIALAVTAILAAVPMIAGLIGHIVGLAPMLGLITAISAGVAGLVHLVQQAFAGPEGPMFRKQLEEIWSLIKEIGRNIKDGLVGAFSYVAQIIANTFGSTGSLQRWFNTALRSSLEWFRVLLKSISIFTSNWDLAWQFMRKSAQISIAYIGELMAHFFKTSVLGPLKGIDAAIVASSKELAKRLPSIYRAVIDYISRLFDIMFQQIARRQMAILRAATLQAMGATKAAEAVLSKALLNDNIRVMKEQVKATVELWRKLDSIPAKVGLAAAKAYWKEAGNTRPFERSDRIKKMEVELAKIWNQLQAARFEKNLVDFIAGLGLERFTPGALGEKIAGVALKVSGTTEGLFEEFLNLFQPDKPKAAEEEAQRKKADFVGLEELNKRMQAALTDEDAKRHKEVVKEVKRGADAADRGAKVGEAIVSGVFAVRDAVKGLSLGFGN